MLPELRVRTAISAKRNSKLTVDVVVILNKGPDCPQIQYNFQVSLKQYHLNLMLLNDVIFWSSPVVLEIISTESVQCPKTSPPPSFRRLPDYPSLDQHDT